MHNPYSCAKPGARYRPLSWHDLASGALLGYGLEERRPGTRAYVAVGWNEKAYPFANKAQAQLGADGLNAHAQGKAFAAAQR